MKLDAATARILLALFIGFHNADLGVGMDDLSEEERAGLLLTEEEADRGLSIIETEFDCDIAAVGRALAETPEITGALHEMVAAGAL